jgi:MoaA/NifB/PqqE/SkfB family radical SAM enzyme
MDAYLASGSLTDSHTFYFNLNLELLNGCQWNCKGCHVNKDDAVAFSDDHYNQLMSVMDSFDDNNYYKPFIAFIAPTDFLSAKNTYSVLTDKRIIKIFNRFKRLSFQTTYLDISKASLIADILRDHYSDLELEINVIIEPEQIDNEKYLATLKKNQDEVISMLRWPTKVRSFGIMNVFDYENTRIAELIKDYDFLHQKVHHLFETTIDFNFSFGRKDEKLEGQEFWESANRIKKMFNDSIVTNEKNNYLRFSFGRLSDSLVERQYNWKNGEFYYSPLLYERYASFIDDLKIPTPTFHSKDFESYEQDVQLNQYLNVGDKEECGDCPFLGSCVDRGILHLMDIHGVKKCLVAKNALEVVNAMGTLPYGN